MNTYDWMADQTEEEPPLHEDDSREDPGHRPTVPDDGNGDTREHHSDPSHAQGGRNQDAAAEFPHEQEHSILDPQQQEDLTASNESIIESVRKFFKMHNRGKNFEELDGNAKASMAKVYKNLEDTFGSSEWVEKQTSITGEIKVGDLADRIGLDNLVGTIKETAAINDSFQEAIIAAQLTVVREIAQLTSKWNPDKLTDKMYEEVKAKLPSIKSMADLMKKPTRAKTNLITGKQTDEKRAPLTKEETLALAQEIVKAMKADHARILSTNEEIHTLLQKFWDVQYEVRREDAHSESYNTAAWEALIEALARKMPASSPESMAAFRQFEGACVASVIYMERSFRGGKVSNESFTVSNEGIFDSIKALFAKKPESLDVKWVDESLKKSFDKTLLNDAWLDKQKFTTGDVSVEFPKAAKGDYKALGKAMKAALDEAEAKNIEVGKKHYGKVMEAFKAMNKDIGKRSVAEIQKLRDIASYDDMDFDAPWVEPKQVTSPVGAVAMTALDKAEIKAVANAIIEYSSMLADYNEACMIYLPDNDTHATWRIILENTPDKSKLPLLKEYHDDLDSIYDYSHESFFNQCTGQWELVENLTYGLMRWISKSISGVNFSE